MSLQSLPAKVRMTVGSGPPLSAYVYRAAVAGAAVKVAREPESNRAARASLASRRRIGPAQGR